MILHLAARRVVGWAMGATLEAMLPLTALQMALRMLRPAAGAGALLGSRESIREGDYQAVLIALASRRA